MKKRSSKRKLTEPTQTEKKTTAEPKVNNDLALPLPRPERKKRKPKEDRGLPPDDELKRLAEEYLKFQRAKWPDLVELGHLPEVSESIINVMVKDFKNRHRTAQLDSQLADSIPTGKIATSALLLLDFRVDGL